MLAFENATIKDAREILDLQKLAYQSEAAIYNDFSIPPLTQTMEGMLNDFQKQAVLKVVVDGRIIGSVRGHLQDGTGYIGRLIVHPDYQQRGIGTQLLKAIEERLRQAKRYELFTGHKSERNLRLYDKLGYKRCRSETINDHLQQIYLEKKVNWHIKQQEDYPMAKALKGSETEKNLLKAFAGESQARNRYTFFAGVARKEGYEQIANVFTETAGNEKEHAEIFFKYLKGGDLEITASFPSGMIADTKANLEAAAAGEKMEWSAIYAEFEKTARSEGFNDIATSFKEISEVEEFHEKRYLKLASNIANGEVFKKKATVKWHCTNCGYIHEGTDAPKVCPACKHAQAYYELLSENY